MRLKPLVLPRTLAMPLPLSRCPQPPSWLLVQPLSVSSLDRFSCSLRHSDWIRTIYRAVFFAVQDTFRRHRCCLCSRRCWSFLDWHGYCCHPPRRHRTMCPQLLNHDRDWCWLPWFGSISFIVFIGHSINGCPGTSKTPPDRAWSSVAIEFEVAEGDVEVTSATAERRTPSDS